MRTEESFRDSTNRHYRLVVPGTSFAPSFRLPAANISVSLLVISLSPGFQREWADDVGMTLSSALVQQESSKGLQCVFHRPLHDTPFGNPFPASTNRRSGRTSHGGRKLGVR